METVKDLELGDAVEVFAFGQRGRWLALQLLVLAVAVSGLILGGTTTLLIEAPTTSAVLISRLMLSIGIVSLILGVWLVPRLAKARGAGLSLTLHQGGLARQRDRDWEVIRWGDIVGLRQQFEWIDDKTFPRKRYRRVGRVATTDGWFDLPYDHIAALWPIIEEQTRPLAWQRMIAAFERREPFAFGGVVASVDGFTIGNERLQWSQVQLIEDGGRTLRLHTDFGGTVLDRFSVSFVGVLSELCEQMWSHEGNADAIPRTLPPAPPPVLTRAAIPTARLVR